jgi:hypothetical protein
MKPERPNDQQILIDLENRLQPNSLERQSRRLKLMSFPRNFVCQG